jgi:CRISPR-associated protein (TIGR02710 family)
VRTLFCSVGGSRAPVLAAIREYQPDRVVFVCSIDDKATGSPGSRSEFLTKTPSLQDEAALENDTWELVEVPADEPATIVEVVKPLLAAAVARGECIVDYTGGTKSMSAALFFAACMTPRARLSLVTGPRVNLMRINDGMERVRSVPTASIDRDKLRQSVAQCWSRHAYVEAEHLARGAPDDARDATTDRWQMMSKGFGLWDAWRHKAALTTLAPFKRYCGDLLQSLGQIVEGRDQGFKHALWIADIHASAERRARAHQYDAAVLRMYRTLEGVAQWTLSSHHQIDASDVRDSAARRFCSQGANNKFVLGCRAAWAAVAELDGPFRDVARGMDEYIKPLEAGRNESVLVHGYRALELDDWERCKELLHAKIWPAFLRVARVNAFQLPTLLP